MECSGGKITENSHAKKSPSRKKIKAGEKYIEKNVPIRKKRTNNDKKIMAQEKRKHTIARQKFGTPKCKKGQIIKEGYHRKQSSKSVGYWVAPTCIMAKGLSRKRGSKGKKLFRLERGTLSQFGYSNVKKLSKKERHQSLKKAINEIKPVSVRKKLIAISTLQKNINPKMSKIFKEDAEWIKNTSEYKNRKK